MNDIVVQKKKRRLRDIPAKMWALIYLALIPIYALIYSSWLSTQFYHSTVQYEQELQGDAGVILSELRDSIIENFRQVHHGDVAESNGWIININDLNVYALHPLSDTLGIKLRIEIGKQTSRGPVMSYIPFEVTYRAADKSAIDVGGNNMKYFKVLSFAPEKLTMYGVEEQYDFPYAVIFPFGNESGYSGPYLQLSPSLNEKLEGFWRGTRGFPSRLSGQFWRMLYLSAITITTVGYGDIVPITTTARMFVASEAILGIVIIGLFINSLVQERT